MRAHVFCLVASLGAFTACKGDPLERPQDIAGWANAASSLGVFLIGYEPLAFADGQDIYADPECPAASDDGTTVHIAGGCEDAAGVAWDGSVTVTRGASGARAVTFEGFGNDAFGGMVRTTGTFAVTRLEAGLHSFEVDVTRDGGIQTAVAYQGTVEGGYTGPTVWNGSGTIERDGATINGGVVAAETVDQRHDAAICSGQGVSGTTTLVSEEHTVVISYDGAQDCDEDAAARWSLDGQDQGLVTGVTCSAAGAGEPLGTALFAAALFGLSLVRRRRATAGARR